MRTFPRSTPPARPRPLMPLQPHQEDAYPAEGQWPQADSSTDQQSPPPPPSPAMDAITAKQVGQFFETGLNTALGMQVHLHHFRIRGVDLPADGCDQLAALFEDLANSLRQA